MKFKVGDIIWTHRVYTKSKHLYVVTKIDEYYDDEYYCFARYIGIIEDSKFIPKVGGLRIAPPALKDYHLLSKAEVAIYL